MLTACKEIYWSLRCLPVMCWPALAAIVLSWFPYLRILSRDLSFGDEGIVAQGALRIYQGEVPIRDFFTALPPVTYYVYAFLFKLFSPSFLTLRLGVVMVSLLTILAVWVILQRLSVQGVAPYLLIGAFLAYFGGPCWFVASHHWLATLFCLISLVFLLPAGNNKNPALQSLVISGGFAAAAALTLQNRGGIWLIAASFVLCLCHEKRWKSLVAFLSGTLVLSVPLVFYLVVMGSWDQFYYDLVRFPTTQYANLGGHNAIDLHPVDMLERYLVAFSHLDEPGVKPQVMVVFFGLFGMYVLYLLPLLASMALVYLWRGRTENTFTIAALGVALLASYLAIYHRIADTTLFYAAPPALLIVTLALARKNARRMIWGGVWFYLALATGYSVLKLTRPTSEFSTPAGLVCTVHPEETETLYLLTRYYNDGGMGKSAYVFCYPYDSMYYFLFRIKNPTGFDNLTYPMHTMAQMISAEQLLEQTGTEWVVFDMYNRRNMLNPELSLERLILKKFVVSAEAPYATILKRVQ